MSSKRKRLISFILICITVLSITTTSVFAGTADSFSIQKRTETATGGGSRGGTVKSTTWFLQYPNRNYFPNMSVEMVVIDTQTNKQIHPSNSALGGAFFKDLHLYKSIKVNTVYSAMFEVKAADGSTSSVKETIGTIESATYDLAKYDHAGTTRSSSKFYDYVNVAIANDETKQGATTLSRKYNVPINTDFNKSTTGTAPIKKGPNVAERYLAEMFVSIADYLYNPIISYGADVDTLIYNGEGSRFKLDFNIASEVDLQNPFVNPFAKVGYIGYAITKSLALAFMLSVLTILFSRMQFNVITKNKLDFKEAMNNYLISFLLILWAPHILNFILFLNNYIVSLLSPTAATGSTYLETLRSAATNTESPTLLGDAALYLSNCVINLYFMIVYASRAIHATLFYMLVPITSLYLNSRKMKPTFDNFISDFFQTITVQFLDALLFLILTLVFVFIDGADAGLIRFIMTCSIIPLRGMAKKYLGIGGSSMASDMLGFAGIMGAASLVRGVVGGGKNLITGVSDGLYNMRRGQKGLSMMNGFGMDNFTQQGGYDMAGGMMTEDVGPAAAMSTNMKMPDISPYMKTHNNPMGYKQDPMREYEMRSRYEDMIRGGKMSMYRSAYSAMGGLTFGAVGGIMGAGLGTTGMIYGAQIAGSVGSGIGHFMGTRKGMDKRFLLPSLQELGIDLKDQKPWQQPEGQSTGALTAGNAVNVSADANVNADLVVQNSSEISNKTGAAMGGALTKVGKQAGAYQNIGLGDSNNDFDIAKTMDLHVKNMPDNIRRQFVDKAKEAAARARSEYAAQGASGQQLDYAVERVQQLSMFNNSVHYAIDEILKSGHNIDTNALNQFSRSVKQEAYKRISKDIQAFTSMDIDVDLNNVL